MSSTGDSGAEETMQLTQEAFKLASAAVHFDKQQNYVGACDYYDKCILNIDEVLNKLPPDSAEWKRLYEIRSKYDDRMEFLRENETSSSFSLTSLGGVKESKPAQKLPRSKRKLSDAETDFQDAFWDDNKQEPIPDDASEVVYWLLRNIKNTMDQGGFITKDIFVPKRIWMQQDVKFSGLSAKNTAFEIIIKLLVSHTEALYLSTDEDSLDLAEASFGGVYEELVTLQNNLSKPFPYIKELKQADSKEEMDGSGSGSGAVPSSGKGQSGQGKSASLSSYVSSFGKNVRKYAEVGFQRLVTAMPSKLSAEELEEYTQLVSRLCDKCQMLNSWYGFIKVAHAQELSRARAYTPPTVPGLETESATSVEMAEDPVASVTAAVAAGANLTAGSGSERGTAGSAGSAGSATVRRSVTTTPALLKIEAIRATLVAISASIRDIVVEILFRDLEYLIDKYMTDTRKAFSRMYWDDEVDNHDS